MARADVPESKNNDNENWYFYGSTCRYSASITAMWFSIWSYIRNCHNQIVYPTHDTKWDSNRNTNAKCVGQPGEQLFPNKVVAKVT